MSDRSGKIDDKGTLNTIVTSPHSTVEMPWVFLVKNPNPGKDDEGVSKVIDVAMTMPLGGKRAGLYHFPRVGERVFVMLTGDRAVLMGYVPDKTGSFSDFPEDGDKWARKATSLRYTPPTGEAKEDGNYAEIGFSHAKTAAEALEQRIIDGTVCLYLESMALDANDNELFNTLHNEDLARIAAVRQAYFSQPGAESSKALSDCAQELVAKYGISEEGSRGTGLRLHSEGRITQTAGGDIDIFTPGHLRINAWDVTINGMSAVHLQSDGKVQAAVGAASATVNGNALEP